MCGIAGIYYFNKSVRSTDIQRMTDSLRHRGPDDEGFLAVHSEWRSAHPLVGGESRVKGERIEHFSEPAHLFLGHRRLSIIDLSSSGHQPMGNEDGSLWVVHNGEIYNYLELRGELRSLGHDFRSQTDTEVILHAYEEWGMGCLRRFNGMWAFALVDLKAQRIFCSRDRAGVKPLYYFYDGERFCFASEIKALLEIEGLSVEANEQRVADYLLGGLLDHTQQTCFRKIDQLRPGEYLVVEEKRLTVRSYWNIEPHEIQGVGEGGYEKGFYELLQDAVSLRLRTDVPIGSCLSGGLDSSSIVCLANRLIFGGHSFPLNLAGERQKTFSACFEDPAYDERQYIEWVILQTGAEKNYVFPKGERLFEELSSLLWHQDEPFGSTSIYAQWAVMRSAKERGVTVLLDGQGADELLAGYLPSYYYWLHQAVKELKVKRMIEGIGGIVKNHVFEGREIIGKMIRSLLLRSREGSGWFDDSFMRRFHTHSSCPVKFKNALDDYLYRLFRYLKLPALLHYEDRNSMAFSLETRLPFLDYRLVEYAFALPPEQKINRGMTKAILRNAMEGTLPERIVRRVDKKAFGTPEGLWFRTLLRDPIEEIISSKSFAERGYFNVKKVKKGFEEHCEGKMDRSLLLWRCVNLELWCRLFIDKGSSLGGAKSHA
jgi:asparagine synthase (glutamine-hydrolysing)